MGYSRWNASDWASYTTTVSTKKSEEIFTNKKLVNKLNPYDVDRREARDSDANPESTAIMIFSDVTGSMGSIAETLVRSSIGTVVEEILDRKPVTDPQILVGAIGDVYFDSVPLQVSQFEADITITNWLEQIYIEGNGGGNAFESYDLPAYFAANHTSIDCFEKRGKKGYLFTIGDEPPPKVTSKQGIDKVIGDKIQDDIPYEDVIEAASRMYHIYHIIVKEGFYCRSRGVDDVKQKWNEYLGQNAIVLTDLDNLAEVIVSTIEINEGRDKDEVINSWSGDTSMVVATAVKDLDPSKQFDSAKDVVKF